MSPNDILRFVRRRPFEPFRLLVRDGSSYEIRHPENCMVLATSVVIGTPSADIPETAEWIDVRHIHKLIPLGPSITAPDAPPRNGPTDEPPNPAAQ